MNLIILAAGEGRRLRPLTENTPKCFVELEGTPLLISQAKAYEGIPLNKKYIVTGYKRGVLQNYIHENAFIERENPRFDSTNMLYSLNCAEEALTDRTILTYADIIYPKSVLDKLLESTAAISIAVDRNWKDYWEKRVEDPLSDAETMKVDSNGYVTELGKKAKSIGEIEGQYIGLIHMTKEGALLFRKYLQTLLNSKELIEGKSFEKAYMTDFLQTLINRGVKIKAVYFDEPWIEIDSFEDHQNPITHSRFRQIMLKASK